MDWILAITGGVAMLSMLAAAVLFYRFADAFFMGDQPQAFTVVAAGLAVSGMAFGTGVLVGPAFQLPVLVFELFGALMVALGFYLGYRESAGDLL